MSEQLIRRDLEAELVVRAAADGTEERVIEGIVVPYNQIATVRSMGERPIKAGVVYRETMLPGAARSIDPQRVTVESTEHKGKLVGRGLSAEDRPEGLHMALKVAKTPAGDELLELAREGVLTGMSVVFAPGEERIRPDGVVERSAIDIRRVAVLERGAYPDAQVSAVRAEPEVHPTTERKTPVASETYTSPEEKATRLAELKKDLTRQGQETLGVRSVEAQARWDADLAEHDKLTADLAVIEATRARIASLGEDKINSISGSAPAVIVSRGVEDIYNPDQFSGIGYRNTDERDLAMRDNAMRSLETNRVQNDKLAELVDHDVHNKRGLPSVAERLLKTGSPAYKRAFGKYLVSGNEFGFTEAERAAVAVVGTTTTGGYAVPYIFDPSVVRVGVWTAQNPFRAACKTVTITNGNNWKGVSVGAVTAAYAAEAATASENGPTWGTLDYTVRRAQAFVTLSIEALEDRSDFTQELTQLFGEAKDTLEENKFAVGDGNAPNPLGMFTDTAFTNQDTATDNVTAIADIQVLEGALPLRFRKNAAFFMNRSTLRQLLALDTTYRYFSGAGLQFPGTNQPQWTAGGNTGFSLLGYPVWEVPSAVSTLTTDGAIIVVFCDPSFYQIVDRIGMNVEVIQNMQSGATPGFPTGQRGVYAYWRNTAKPIAADAGRSLSVQ